MGLFGFLKKGDIAPPKPFDIGDIKSDLPSIEGLSLPESSELPELDLPPMETPLPSESPLTLNDRIPGIRRQEPLQKEPLQEEFQQGGLQYDGNQQFAPVEYNPQESFSFDASDTNPEPSPNEQFEDISMDINQLFLSDPNWKEPDWSEYVPYEEPIIEPPQPQDFPVEEVVDEPIRKNLGIPIQNRPPKSKISTEPKDYDLPTFDILDQQHKPLPQGDLPYDVYVKGPDFKKIIDDINLIKTTLNYQDNTMTDVMEKFKSEADMLAYNKELIDFLFKKMVYIEKRVFTG